MLMQAPFLALSVVALACISSAFPFVNVAVLPQNMEIPKATGLYTPSDIASRELSTGIDAELTEKGIVLPSLMTRHIFSNLNIDILYAESLPALDTSHLARSTPVSVSSESEPSASASSAPHSASIWTRLWNGNADYRRALVSRLWNGNADYKRRTRRILTSRFWDSDITVSVPHDEPASKNANYLPNDATLVTRSSATPLSNPILSSSSPE